MNGVCNLQKLPPPKSKKSEEQRPLEHPMFAGVDLCDILRDKSCQAISAKIKALEQRANAAANGAQSSDSQLTPNEIAVLTALKIQEKKLNMIDRQQKLRARVLDAACPPATRPIVDTITGHKIQPIPILHDLPPVSMA